MKIQNAIIMIKSYGILVSEFAAGGKARNELKTIDLLKEIIVKYLKKSSSYLCLLREMGAGGKKCRFILGHQNGRAHRESGSAPD